MKGKMQKLVFHLFEYGKLATERRDTPERRVIPRVIRIQWAWGEVVQSMYGWLSFRKKSLSALSFTLSH